MPHPGVRGEVRRPRGRRVSGAPAQHARARRVFAASWSAVALVAPPWSGPVPPIARADHAGGSRLADPAAGPARCAPTAADDPVLRHAIDAQAFPPVASRVRAAVGLVRLAFSAAPSDGR